MNHIENGNGGEVTRGTAVLIGAVLALVLTACGGGTQPTTTSGELVPGNPVAGAAVYSGTCATCHAPDLSGIDGLGNPLVDSEFIASLSEDELAAYIAVGRPSNDPANTTGISMPARGGNPTLSDQDLLDVAAYLKAQQ